MKKETTDKVKEDNKIPSPETSLDLAESQLGRYLELTEKIRDLSVPQIREDTEADNYRKTLLENYTEIGALAKESGAIINEYFYPKLKDDSPLSKEEIKVMRDFSRALSNAYQINNIDIPLVYYQAKRLLQEADRTDDDDMLVMALDEMVSTAYVMSSMTQRLLPVGEVCFEYTSAGLEAAERLLEFLDKDKFVKLSDDSKEMVLVNARYIRVVSEVNGIPGEPEQNALMLERMKTALALGDDPFYRDQVPDYNWSIHEFRTLEYICSLTDHNNEKNYGPEDLKFINECTKRMKEVYDADPLCRAAHNTGDLDLYLCRNAYLAGEISLEECKKRLAALSMQDFRKELTDGVLLVMLHAPLEYICMLDKDNLSEEEKTYLAQYYNLLVKYMHQTPKKGRLTFLLSYLSLILKHFIELPGVMDFETLCLNLIAALHPPTYVHTLAVADFTQCLTHHLLKRQPDLFIGMPGMETVDDVIAHAEDIENFAYHAALCHDFGKLTIVETIITYGRRLMDEEFRFIKNHEDVGAYLLSLYPSTEQYADIACGHHKWFDNINGYPDDFDLYASPYKTIICIVTCADCLDAATDTVGRSYKQGKSLHELIDEFKAESGTRYAPFVVELLSDDEVLREITEILEEERDHNYIETYNTLKQNESGE